MRLFLFSVFLIYVVAETLTGCLSDSSGDSYHDSKKKNKEDPSFDLNIPEPSGLAFSPSKNALYVVSDKNGGIYKISFTGEVLEKIPSGANDLEGIDVDKTNGSIWIVEEKKEIVYHLESDGEMVEKISDIHIKTKDNSGFEGIAVNGNMLYILIEKNPGSLIVYNTSTRSWNKYRLSFADDYSGIDYDTSDSTLWIVSDESKTLNHCNTDGSLIASQKIDAKQAEGVVVDRKSGIAWIIDETGHELHRIRLKI